MNRIRLRAGSTALAGAVVVLCCSGVLGLSGALGLSATAAAGVERVPAATEGTQSWAVTPADAAGPDGRAAFEYIAEPADRYLDHVAVRNLGWSPITVTLYAQDAVQTTENAFDVRTPDEQAEGVGRWLVLEAGEVTVPARSHVVVPFAIDVPADAEPGDHAGAIVAVSQPDAEQKTAVQYRVGSRIHLRVAGPVEAALEVDGLVAAHESRWGLFAPAPLDVHATLENTGNIRLIPEVRIEAEGLFGWWSGEAPLTGFDEILPEGAQSASARLEQVPPIGPIWVSVTVDAVASAGQDVTAMTAVETRTVLVWAMPWTLLGALVLLAAAVLVALGNLRWRRRRARAHELTA